jgi:hypothetical protein
VALLKCCMFGCREWWVDEVEERGLILMILLLCRKGDGD